MVAIETIATVEEDGAITARAPEAMPRGRHRAVIVLDELALDKDLGQADRRGFPT